jgi:uncharacterized SAM-binding protein YcdF (DUF218 family)
MTKILLVLGSPNSSDGELSQMAISRLDVCWQWYATERTPIVLTGGFGAHFNTTDKPHAQYLKENLLARGVLSTDILALIESANTVEDAVLSKWIVETYTPQEVIVITSVYHLARAKMVFEAVYAPFQQLAFVPASTENLDCHVLDPLLRHEARALQDLKDNGVRF